MSDPIVVGLASDERYFPGLFVTIVSVIISTKTDRTIEFNIIDGGILDSSWDALVLAAVKINAKVVFKRHKLSLSLYSEFPKWIWGSDLVYARFLFPELLNANQIIYLDSDIFFGRDIEELWIASFDGNLLLAVEDGIIRTFDFDGFCNGKRLCEECGVSGDTRYFNAGVLKFDLHQWKKLNCTVEVLNWLKKYNGFYNFQDQSALNYLFYNKVKFMPKYFNLMVGVHLLDFRKNSVFHFISRDKPWLLGFSDSFDPCYFVYDELLKRLPITLMKKKSQSIFKMLTFKFPLVSVFYFKARLYLCKLLRRNRWEIRFIEVSSNYWIRLYRSKRSPEAIRLRKEFVVFWLSKLKLLNVLDV
jgi:lipopolysaccharide biosynthesis glycosyltransferase